MAKAETVYKCGVVYEKIMYNTNIKEFIKILCVQQVQSKFKTIWLISTMRDHHNDGASIARNNKFCFTMKFNSELTFIM